MTTDETKADTARGKPRGAAKQVPVKGAPAEQGRALARVLQGRAVMVRQLDLARMRIGSSAQALQGKAVPAAARSAALVKQRSSDAVVRLKRFSREDALPRASLFVRRLRRRLRPQSIMRDYRRLLLLLHTNFAGRAQEALFFVPTRDHIRSVRLSIPSQVRQTAHDYRPTPFKVFAWAMAALPRDKDFRETTFVDFGAGRGRVLLLASQFPFEAVTGAEIARELHDDCLMNIAQYPRSLMRCREVSCIHSRATTLPIPEGPTVFYFFDPFDRSMFERVLGEIARSYKRAPRELYLICVDMREAEAVEATGMFEAVKPTLALRLKVGLFSPYRIGVYKAEP